MNSESNCFVSIIIPTRNEAKFIGRCLESLAQQDYPSQLWEVILVDGKSSDWTKEIAASFKNSFNLKILDNPRLTAPTGLNLGIKEAQGAVIIRVDGHTCVGPEFIRRSVENLKRSGAAGVGGPLETVGESWWGRKIALVLSSPFCVADAKFRYATKPQEVDTVAFGAYRREVFEKIGLFNERLVRNQDIEFNSRLRQNGGRLFLFPDIKIKYFCRSSLFELGKQCFQNGFWNLKTIWLVSGSLRWRHFIPLFFSFFIITALIISFFVSQFFYLLISVLLVYFGLGFLFSGQIALKTRCVSDWLVIPAVYFWFHFTYGVGSLFGLGELLIKEKGR